jgi:hypothetical protein
MGFTSQQGQVGFGVQTVQGTAVAATRFARLRGGALEPNRDLLIPDPEIGGNRDVPQAYLGPISYAGGYEFYARLQMLAILLRGALGAPTSTNVVGANEVQTLNITGTPTGGNFTLTFRGQTTSSIAHNAASAAIQTALQALTTIGAGNVTVSGTAPGPFTITFTSALAASNPPLITLASNTLTGGTSPSVTIATTTPGFAPRGTHVFTPSDAASLPWMTVEERLSFNLESFRYTDAKVSRLRLEGDATGYVMGQCDLIAMTQAANFTAQANPNVDTSPMLLGSQITVSWNGTPLPAKSFNFEIANNMEDNDFRLGSFTLGDITEKRRMFKLGATIRPNNSALWREAVYGGAGLTAPRAGRASYGSLALTMTTFEDVQGASTPYSLTITVPTAAIAPFAITPRGEDVIEHDIEFTLLRDDPVVPVCTVTVVNDLATVV